jgi:hypothetical protein
LGYYKITRTDRKIINFALKLPREPVSGLLGNKPFRHESTLARVAFQSQPGFEAKSVLYKKREKVKREDGRLLGTVQK